eukprot:SAG11_NODE_654_length_7909_cov_7.701280_8_plen_90_part_00
MYQCARNNMGWRLPRKGHVHLELLLEQPPHVSVNCISHHFSCGTNPTNCRAPPKFATVNGDVTGSATVQLPVVPPVACLKTMTFAHPHQ